MTTSQSITRAFALTAKAAATMNSVDLEQLTGIRKAEIERAARKLNEAFSILSRDQRIHEE